MFIENVTHAEFPYAQFDWLFIIHTHQFYCEITQFMTKNPLIYTQSKKVISCLTLFDITLKNIWLKLFIENVTHAEFPYAQFDWLFIIHTHQFYCEITQFMNRVQEKKLHILSIGL